MNCKQKYNWRCINMRLFGESDMEKNANKQIIAEIEEKNPGVKIIDLE